MPKKTRTRTAAPTSGNARTKRGAAKRTTRPKHASLPVPDFRALFESAPGLYLVLTPDALLHKVREILDEPRQAAS